MIVVMSCEFTSAQAFCFCYKGAWSEWTVEYSHFSSKESVMRHFISLYGNVYGASDYSGFSFKKYGVTYFKFTIDYPFKVAPKKVRKEHLKKGEWYVYSGTVEYYVNDAYPTAQEIAKYNHFVMPDPRLDVTPCVKRTCNATIKIAPYKKHPECYNIWFDGIGVMFNTKYLIF